MRFAAGRAIARNASKRIFRERDVHFGTAVYYRRVIVARGGPEELFACARNVASPEGLRESDRAPIQFKCSSQASA